MRWALIIVAASLVLAAPAVAADEAEARLRDALRSATVQLRGLEDQQAVLQAKLSVAEKERDAVRDRLAAATAQLAAARKAADDKAALADQRAAALAERDAAIDRTRGILGQCRSSYQQQVATGQALQEKQAQLNQSMAAESKRAAACEDRNRALYKVAKEILDAYAAVDLADALVTREPFLGLKRVELETLVQDYGDRLLDARIAP